MNSTRVLGSHHGRLRRAVTLVEAVVSTAIVGVMLVAALNTVGASQVTQNKMGQRSRALLLAQDLMAEILQQAYEDPDLVSGSFGLTVAEMSDGTRSLWNDVDDYNGWSASPPQQKDGTELSDFTGWRRSASVDWVDPTNVGTELGSDTGIKRITVTVTFNDLPLAQLWALKTSTWESGLE